MHQSVHNFLRTDELHLDQKIRPGHEELRDVRVIVSGDSKKGIEENFNHLCGMSCLSFSCIDEEFLLGGAEWILFLVILIVRKTKGLV